MRHFSYLRATGLCISDTIPCAATLIKCTIRTNRGDINIYGLLLDSYRYFNKLNGVIRLEIVTNCGNKETFFVTTAAKYSSHRREKSFSVVIELVRNEMAAFDRLYGFTL